MARTGHNGLTGRRGVRRLLACGLIAWMGTMGMMGTQAGAQPPAPTQPSATIVHSGKAGTWVRRAVLVTWTDTSQDELQFAVERQSKRDGVWREGNMVRVPRNTSALMDNPGEGDHRYRVRAEGDKEASGWSEWTQTEVSNREATTQAVPTPPPLPEPQPNVADRSGSNTEQEFFIPHRSPDTRVVHIASSGDDENDGATPDRPIRTFIRAYALMRDTYPDHLLLRAGDTFENTSIANGYGGWDKGGRSLREPMVIGVYGEGVRPTIRVRDGAHGMLIMGNDLWNGNIVIAGLHFENDRPDPDKGGVGVRMFGIGGNILIEDCLFEKFTGNVSFESSINNDSSPSNWIVNVTLRRCVLVDAFGGTGHSQGSYFSMVDGLLIDECVVDHNGWSETVPGKNSTIYNHNFYVQPSCTNVLIRDTISTRAAATGAQMRGRDQSVVDCLFVDNAIHITAGHGQARWPQQAWRGRFVGNVIQGGTDIGLPGTKREPRGFGIGIATSDNGVVRGNLISQLTGGAKAGFWINEPNFTWTVEGNIMYEATGRFVRDDRRRETTPVLGANQFVTEADRLWVDPERNVSTYMSSLGMKGDDASLAAFLRSARDRERGTWDARFTARAVNVHIREGFGMAGPSEQESREPVTVVPMGP
jgi:hypothetical protein